MKGRTWREEHEVILLKQLHLSHNCLWQSISVQKALYQRHSRQFMFSFPVQSLDHINLTSTQHILWYSRIRRRPKWRLLAKESWEALLDLTFYEALRCTRPVFNFLSNIQTPLNLLVAFTVCLNCSCLECSVVRIFWKAKIVNDTSLLYFSA